MQFTTLSRLIGQSFEDELSNGGDLPGRTEEPVLAGLDAHAIVCAMRDPARSLDEQGSILAAVIRCYRKASTPVGVVTNAFRHGQVVDITSLDALDVERVGMGSIVVVGNSQTELICGRMVTPRGYP